VIPILEGIVTFIVLGGVAWLLHRWATSTDPLEHHRIELTHDVADEPDWDWPARRADPTPPYDVLAEERRQHPALYVVAEDDRV
jgi:hypothetical protein